MKVFSGSSQQLLAKEIAQVLDSTVGEVEVTEFANGESRVWVREKHVGTSAIVVQSLNMPVEKHMVEFSFLCDALHRMGVREITAVIPWMGYSKQDKVFRPGESLSVKVIAKMLQVVPLKHILTFDLHNLAILGFFDVPVTNLSARELLLAEFQNMKNDKTIVVSPDEGAVKNSTAFAHELGVPVVYMDKKRDLTTGEVKIHGMSRSVEGCEAIIVDDMIITGGTLIETAKYLKGYGAKSVHVGTTHHLYVPGAQEKIELNGIDLVVTTNTVSPKQHHPKLKVLSVAPIIAAAIGELSHDWSGH